MHSLSSVAEHKPVDVVTLLEVELVVELLVDPDEDDEVVVVVVLELLVEAFDEEELVAAEAYKTRKLRATTVKMVLI